MRLTVFRLLLVTAIAAIALHLLTAPYKARAGRHHNRCLDLAGRHSALASEYRRNAHGGAAMLGIAARHDAVRREYEAAASAPGDPIPPSRPFPSKSWVPLSEN